MRRAFILAAIVCFVAIGIRLIPLANSSLPYNIDGFSIVSIAERTQASGFLTPVADDPNLPNYNVPLFSVLLTALSDVVGVEPLVLAQLMMPILSLPAFLATFAIMRRITKNDAAASAAALFLALEGMFVFFTATVVKASMAFALIPLILYLYWERANKYKRLLAAFLLVVLPLVHHLSALIVFMMVSLILFNDLLKWWKQGSLTSRIFAREIILGPALFIPGMLHYDLVNLLYLREVDDPRQILLFLSVFFVFALIYRSLVLPSRSGTRFETRKAKRWRLIFDNKLVYPVGAVVLLLVNYQSNIFAGTEKTSAALLETLVPYVLLVMICLVGFNLFRHFRNQHRPFVMALIIAPFSVMVFAFLRGLDPLSFLIMYRSYPYLAFGIALCAGLGVAFIISLIRNRGVKAAIVSGFIALLLLSLPLGYGSERVFGVENSTAEYEFRAMVHLNSLGPSYVGSDQRIGDVLRSYFYLDVNKFFPELIAHDKPINTCDFVLILDGWTTQGAQMYPLPNLAIDSERMVRLQEDNDVIYSVVSPVGGAVILRTR